MTARRLVIFDVDGTLVDSQAHILGAMARAFTTLGLAPPDRSRTHDWSYHLLATTLRNDLPRK